MTNEEAIKMFKDIIMVEIGRLPHHYDAEVDDDVYDDISSVDELLQLNKIVSKSLKKQIPKKPVYGAANIKCPNCGATLLYYFHSFKIDYCDECGQRLDWSEENDE